MSNPLVMYPGVPVISGGATAPGGASGSGGGAYWTGGIGAVMAVEYTAAGIWQYIWGASTLPTLA